MTAPAPAPAPPAVVTLPGAICDRARDGETILRVQTAVDRLMPRLQTDPAYGGAWYEHAPCYRIVFAFTDGQPRQWVIDAAEPDLRPYIAFAGAKYSEAEREQARREIMAALEASGLPSVFTVSVRPTYFTVTVRTEAEARIAASVIPTHYRSDVAIFVGPIERIPEREASAASEVLLRPQLTRDQIAQFQLQVIPLNRNARQLPGFSDIYIEHEPTWHVVVAFTEPPPRAQIIALAPPAIRDRILVERAKRTAEQISADLNLLAAALQATGIDWTGGYSPKTERFTVTVGAAAQVAPMRAALPPRLREDTDVIKGALPVPE